jgi:hypothetical protein
MSKKLIFENYTKNNKIIDNLVQQQINPYPRRGGLNGYVPLRNTVN